MQRPTRATIRCRSTPPPLIVYSTHMRVSRAKRPFHWKTSPRPPPRCAPLPPHKPHPPPPSVAPSRGSRTGCYRCGDDRRRTPSGQPRVHGHQHGAEADRGGHTQDERGREGWSGYHSGALAKEPHTILAASLL